jgi:hypothetical protein
VFGQLIGPDLHADVGLFKRRREEPDHDLVAAALHPQSWHTQVSIATIALTFSTVFSIIEDEHT